MIYVDPIMERSESAPLPRSCRLMAHDVEELHAFARRIGCRRGWYSEDPIPHYTLSPGYRQKAVGFRAHQLDLEGARDMERRWRQRLSTPGRDA